jgi:hypothetical protein
VDCPECTVDCPECTRLYIEDGKRRRAYGSVIDRLSSFPDWEVYRAIWRDAADEARINLVMAALELERHQESHL